MTFRPDPGIPSWARRAAEVAKIEAAASDRAPVTEADAMSLARGAYATDAIERTNARGRWLLYLSWEASDVVRELLPLLPTMRDAAPFYRAALLRGYANVGAFPLWHTVEIGALPNRQDAVGREAAALFAALRDGITSWARRHNLGERWILADAAWSLLCWTYEATAPRYPELGHFGALVRLGDVRFVRDGEELPIPQPSPIEGRIVWDGLTDQVQDARDAARRIVDAMAQHLKGRADDADDILRPTTRSPHFGDHARWLVEYQVRGLSFEEIADADVNPASVGQSVRKMARLIGLPLRDYSVGRQHTIRRRHS